MAKLLSPSVARIENAKEKTSARMEAGVKKKWFVSKRAAMGGEEEDGDSTGKQDGKSTNANSLFNYRRMLSFVRRDHSVGKIRWRCSRKKSLNGSTALVLRICLLWSKVKPRRKIPRKKKFLSCRQVLYRKSLNGEDRSVGILSMPF